MPDYTEITPGELERQAQDSFEGQAWECLLCLNPGALDKTSTRTEWEAEEVSGNGYTRVAGTLGTGTYNAGTNVYALPTIEPTFTATGTGIEYDTVVYFVGTTSDFPHSIKSLVSPDTIPGGESKPFPLIISVRGLTA